jgi:hypothetical protein
MCWFVAGHLRLHRGLYMLMPDVKCGIETGKCALCVQNSIQFYTKSANLE